MTPLPLSNEHPPAAFRKSSCPQCGGACREVSSRTIRHQIRQPWHWQELADHYYFCGNPGCAVAYWGNDGSILPGSRLRQDDSGMALFCYCFGITQEDLQDDPTVHPFLISQTREKQCACEIRNPTGRCCLSSLKHFENDGTNANAESNHE